MTIFQTIGVLIALAALLSYVNHRYLHLPSTIGLMAITLLGSLAMVLLGHFGILDLANAATFVASINFSAVFLHGMLGFLLFAGALHVDVQELRNAKVPVAVLATVGVVAATFLIGILFWAGAHWLGYQISLIHALLFGALIAPTDPIAVLGIIRKSGASKRLEAVISGESLFNDGMGVIMFLVFLGIATGRSSPEADSLLLFLLREVAGGAVMGLILGWLTYRLLATVDDYKVEILLTLGLVGGGYTLADALQVSAPITMVVAGLLIGSHGRTAAMSDTTRQHVDLFWELVDEILNALLFMLIGMEIIQLQLDSSHLIIGALAIVVVLIGRFVSVWLPIRTLRWLRQAFIFGSSTLLTWGGLRGGLSIAMALSIPHQQERGLILTATYMVVIFSVLVQGLTLGHAVRIIGQWEERLKR